MEIGKSNEFGQLSELELIDFEKANEVSLPNDYRVFLLRYNGGKTKPDRVRSPETILTCLLGMHNGEYYASLYKHIEAYRLRLPFSTLPIGTDPFGNLFIMSIHPEGFGHIYFWNHEGETEIQEGHYTDNCFFVDYSFNDFANGLYTSTICSGLIC